MFKILILQCYDNISDDQTEYQILDRLSFTHFLGISGSGDVPEAKTIWRFRDNLIKVQLAEKLFEVFGDYLEEANLIAYKGKLLDASFINAPIQGNTKAKNKTVKAGDAPTNWKNDSNKLRQKDLDATWTKKGKQSYYAYKTHIKVDKVSKLIIKGEVSTASVHDSQLLEVFD